LSERAIRSAAAPLMPVAAFQARSCA